MPKSRRYDVEDDDFDPPPRRRPAPASGGNTAVKIIAIVGGVLVVLFLVCGGAIYYAVYSTKKVVDDTRTDFNQHVEKNQQEFNKRVQQQEKEFNQRVEQDRKEMRDRQKARENSDKNLSLQAAQAFLQEIKGKRTDAAYAMTSAAYQARVARDEFENFLQKHADVLQQAVGFFPDAFAPESGNTYHYERKVVVLGGFQTIGVTVIKQAAGKAVDDFTVN